jgi:hypothetical protein
MSVIRAHFDGKAFVPDEPVMVPVGTAADVLVVAEPAGKNSDDKPRRPLSELAALLDALPCDTDLPPDASINVDHYLYGHPKREN